MASCPIDGRIQIGNEIRSYGTFTNALADYIPVDPTEVYVEITKPDGANQTYQYGVDLEVRKESTGVYYIEVTLDQAGDWYFRWYSQGLVICNSEMSLRVLSTVS